MSVVRLFNVCVKFMPNLELDLTWNLCYKLPFDQISGYKWTDSFSMLRYLVKTLHSYSRIHSSLWWRNKIFRNSHNQHKCIIGFKGSIARTYNLHFLLRLAIFITWPSELLCTVAFCAALLAYVCRLHMHHSLDREAFTQIQSLCTRKQFMQNFLDPLRKNRSCLSIINFLMLVIKFVK